MNSLALLAVLLLHAQTSTTKAVTPKKVTARKKIAKKAAVKAPVVTAAMRQAALDDVERRLNESEARFENPAALIPFFTALATAQDKPLHILQFGDSHTASDDLVNSIRVALQTKYGSGGAGFAHAGHPFRGYRRFDVQGSNSLGWVTEGTMAHLGDGREGLSGVSITAQTPGQTVTLTTACDALELYYLQQPGGGKLDFQVDGQSIEVIETAGETSPAFYRFMPVPGLHQYTLRTLSRAPVRLFGWTSDYNRGVTVETLGINGAQAHTILNWDETIWQAEVARRDPALIILEYGTNEANSPKWTEPEYGAELIAAITRVRNAAPAASLLLIGPPDCGRLRPLGHLEEVIEVQRKVARAMGVAFWDWREHMGGAGASARWVRAGLGQADYIHLTGEGYRRVGLMLTGELDAGYAAYRSVASATANYEQTREDRRDR